MPLVENFPNYVMLDSNLEVSAIRSAFYKNQDSWQQRSNESFFADCGWYKFPYCSFVPWYHELNTPDIIGVGPTELFQASKDTVMEVSAMLEDCLHDQFVCWGAELNLVHPNGLVKRHFDRHFYSDYTTRVHVVIETNTQTKFIFQNDQKVFATGDCFIFNNKLEHSIYNGGKEPRLHLVIDYVPVDIFLYVERSIAPFGGHEGTKHILNCLQDDHPLYNTFIAKIHNHKEIVPRKTVERLNPTKAHKLA